MDVSTITRSRTLPGHETLAAEKAERRRAAERAMEIERLCHIAVHEAGHAVVVCYFGMIEGAECSVYLVSIAEGTASVGITRWRGWLKDRQALALNYAGLMAQTVFQHALPDVDLDALGERLANVPLREDSPALSSDQDSIDKAGKSIEVAACTQDLLRYPPIRAAVRSIAQRLLEVAELEGSEVEALFSEAWTVRGGRANVALEIFWNETDEHKR